MLFFTAPTESAPTVEPPVDAAAVVTTLADLAARLHDGSAEAVILDEACDFETLAAAADVLHRQRLTTFLLVDRCCLGSLDRVLQLDLDCLVPRSTPPKELRAILAPYVAAR